MAFKKQGQIKLKWVVGKYLDNSDEELHSYRDLASNLLKWSWFRISSLAEKANSVFFLLFCGNKKSKQAKSLRKRNFCRRCAFFLLTVSILLFQKTVLIHVIFMKWICFHHLIYYDQVWKEKSHTKTHMVFLPEKEYFIDKGWRWSGITGFCDNQLKTNVYKEWWRDINRIDK